MSRLPAPSSVMAEDALSRTNKEASVKKNWPTLVLLVAGMVTACGPPIVPRTVPFNEAEYRPYASKGTGSIMGELDVTSPNGGVETGARCEEAFLAPVTSYSTEWFQREIVNGEQLADQDPRAGAYHRQTLVKGTSHFHFENLPPGSYYLTCHMTWSRWYMSRLRPTMFGESGWAYATVKVGPGEHVTVRLKR
jgi:hypothetical protein